MLYFLKDREDLCNDFQIEFGSPDLRALFEVEKNYKNSSLMRAMTKMETFYKLHDKTANGDYVARNNNLIAVDTESFEYKKGVVAFADLYDGFVEEIFLINQDTNQGVVSCDDGCGWKVLTQQEIDKRKRYFETYGMSYCFFSSDNLKLEERLAIRLGTIHAFDFKSLLDMIGVKEVKKVKEVKETKEKKERKKEEKVMKKFGNFNLENMGMEFGEIDNGQVVFSTQGMAIKQGEKYIAYKENCATDVSPFIMDMGGVFKVPCAPNQLVSGDVIVNNGNFIHVHSYANNIVKGYDYSTSQIIEIVLSKNLFGFNFVTKVVSMFGNMVGGATEDNPFGNIGQMMLMQSFMGGDGNGDKNDFMQMMLMQSLMGGSGANPFENMFNMGTKTQTQTQTQTAVVEEKQGE